MARECGQAWGQPRPSSSASVPSPSSSPVDPDPDPVSTPSDPVPVTDPVPDDPCAPAPASLPSYPSITVDDHPRTKHFKRLELVTPEDGKVVMSSDLSVADASPPQRPRPRVPSSADYKKLVRLVLPKVKLGSDSSTVKKLCLFMVKAHQLSDECARLAASVCSNF